MKYRTLGRTGLRVSEIGHGLWGTGSNEWAGSQSDAAHAAMEASYAAGVNFYDSAWAYGDGVADQILGKFRATHPDIICASKIPPKNEIWPASPNSKFDEIYPIDHIVEFAEKVCNSAAIEIMDLFQFHVWDDSWVLDPQFEKAMSVLKDRGLAKFVGISLNSWEPWNGMKALETDLLDTVQVIYNLFEQRTEDELFPLCQEHNIGVIARVPLDEGSLGGMLNRDTKFGENEWRGHYFGGGALERTLDRVEKVKADVPQGWTLAQLALKFVLNNPVVSTTIVGMRHVDRVAENIAVSDLPELSDEQFAKLRKHRWDREVNEWTN